MSSDIKVALEAAIALAATASFVTSCDKKVTKGF